MAKFFLLVELSCLKKRDLKHKCAVTNVNWNNLTLEFLAKDEQNLLGTTSNYLISEHFKACVILQNMKFIRLAISQPFLKIETSGLDQKIL